VGIVVKVRDAIQRLFGNHVDRAAQHSGVIRRQRKFNAATLLQTFVFGFLKNPRASDEQLAQMAAQCGVSVTPQAIEQRHSPQLVAFLQEVFQRGAQEVVTADRTLAPILERFSSVTLLDGSTLRLPDSLQQAFAGCGGSYDSGKAAVKLQTAFDLRSGAVTVTLEPGKSPDAATDRQHERQGPGSLRITDLGYFNVGVFADRAGAGEYVLSRWQFGTAVRLPSEQDPEQPGDVIDLLAWLSRQPGPFVEHAIFLGKQQAWACRLIAWRLPEEQAARRRQKLREDVLRKRGAEPSAARLALCDWTILVTNVPAALLTAQEAAILYAARWQIELLFKRWKSLNLVDVLSGSTEVRQMVRVWGRLIMSLVQHWLVQACAWGDATKSWSKVCEAIRDFAGRLARSLNDSAALGEVIADMGRVIAKTCRRDKRSKAGTFELLNDCDLLDYRLT
jgi:Transposase DDE domain